MTRVMLVAIAILALGGGLVAACVLQVRNAKAETEATIGNEAETTSQQREQQRLHAQKLESLGFLASRIAHDLNNILAGIMGYADLAVAELPAADPVHLHIEVIKKAVRRATELTRQVLAYSGNERLSVEPVNLTRTVKELSRLLEVSIPKNAALKHDFAAELPEIQANASQIHQLIMNRFSTPRRPSATWAAQSRSQRARSNAMPKTWPTSVPVTIWQKGFTSAWKWLTPAVAWISRP